MKDLIFTKSLAAAVITLGALAAASSAHARSDVYFSVGVQVPGFYLQAAPVYAQPRSFYTPAPGYYQRQDDGRRYVGRHGQHRGPYGDLDRDGIRNQQDRDRDGDGVRNRYDRLPGNPNRW